MGFTRNYKDTMYSFARLTIFLLLLFAHGASGSVILSVNITLLEKAVSQGAVCTDGSPPAYHWDKGSGSGANNWVISLEGGGWCQNTESCVARSKMHLGSSKFMGDSIAFTGVLHNSKDRNPYFYNWNRVFVRYCDGSSLTGDVEERDPVTNLYYRGYRIWVAVMQDLLQKGLANAKQALLTGCSSGGLATFIHCDDFRNFLPKTAKVKCMPDAGFFLDQPSIDGQYRQRGYFKQLANLHGSVKHLNPSCVASMKDPTMCFFPQYFFKSIKTPFFILNSAIDSWQIRNILAPGDADPTLSWKPCKEDVSNCTPQQIKRLNEYRGAFLQTIYPAIKNQNVGMFIDSCYAHCQATLQATWHAPTTSNSPKLNGSTIAEAAGVWFGANSSKKLIDDEFPRNPTCRNFVYIIPGDKTVSDEQPLVELGDWDNDFQAFVFGNN